MITVMGASGHTGQAIALELLADGEKVRVLGRSKERLASLVAKGAEAIPGDAADAAYLTRAFRGGDAVYALIPPNFQAPDVRAYQDRLGEAITQAVRDSGVKNVVFLSSLGADLPAGTGPIAGLHAQEERLKKLSGVNLLLLRPTYFFENHLGTLKLIKHQGMNGGATAADVPIPMIATRDIAQVAAAALKTRDWKGVTVRELLGQRDLTLNEVTRIIGAKIGKPDLRYVQFPYAEFEKAMTQMGFSPSVAAGYSEMSRAFNEGTIKSREGRGPANTTPTSFESFAAVIAQAYQSA